MRRRDLVAGVGATAAAGVATILATRSARAQRAAVPVVAFIGSSPAQARPDLIQSFHEGLQEGNYVVGRNVVIDYRSVEGHYERMPALAAEFVALKVSAIVAPNAQSALAAKGATQTVPIVFHSGVDPVALGIVKSLARPGGNATGIFSYTSGLVAKRVEIVRDLVPGTRTLALMVNPAFVGAPFQVAEVKQAVAIMGLALRIVEARSKGEIENAFSTIAAERPDALMVAPDVLFTIERDLIVALAARHAVVTMYDFPDYPLVGGLISYGPRRDDLQRLLGRYLAKVLGGALPSDLPVQQASRFEFVINARAARALGLAVPPTLLARADQVIE